ncbi:EAL domain-containing protein [Leifsonia sp. fls2-241-R2A-40a]|uniref:EAL domain-containing protein n=1 Tax=Leifsonia sp. fls2-241-R2A-40a TaxID=3040290 RepID=UPI00254ECD23|nr:EAL domain-containing protein [Leifsonia sp. fls2-241-R2A-40a]
MVTCEAEAKELSDAIAARQLEIHVQPQIDLATGEVVAVEGLSRWMHPTRGPIPPAEFIALAEATGSIHDLGLFALQECCRIGREWREHGNMLSVAVNVSPLQLETDLFFDELERQLAESGLPPAALIVEVTEAERIDDYAVVAGRLDIIQHWGVTVSIDDFGSGHSSIERAVAVHARELKIDRSLVAAGDWDAVADAVTVAHRSGMRVVAEGVETQDQLEHITAAGCDRGQGFHIARPSPPDVFEDWLRSFVR